MANSNEKLIDGIVRLAVELENSSFILSQNSIRRLLRYVVSHSELKFIVDHSNTTYKYQDVLAEALTGTNARKFYLPHDDYKIISLTTGILFNIDRGNIDFLSFLKSYFKGNDVSELYQDFINVVILPYANAFKNLLSKSSNTIDIDDEEKTITFPKMFISQIDNIILSISKGLLDDRSVSDSVKEECMNILEGFYYVIENGYITLLKSMYIGVKNTLSQSKQFSSHLKSLEATLKDFGYLN